VIGFSLGDVESEFKKAKIEPDIIDKAPIEKIEVRKRKYTGLLKKMVLYPNHDLNRIYYRSE